MSLKKFAIHGGKLGSRFHIYGFDAWRGFWPKKDLKKSEAPYDVWYWAWFELHFQVES